MNAMFSDYLSHDSPATYLYAIFAVLVFKKKKFFMWQHWNESRESCCNRMWHAQ